MIDCLNGEIRDRLPDFVHDQLNATARAAVAAHVAHCAACTAEVALLRELRGTLRQAPSVDVARIVAALPAPLRGSRDGRRRFDWRIAAAIAALVIGGGSAAILSGRLREPEVPVSPVAQQTPAAAPRVRQVATSGISIDADLAEATPLELQALLEDLETFDGLPAGEPEPAAATSGVGEEGL
jgi:anti-sigma factor RsiW